MRGDKKPEGPLFWRNIAERRIRNALPERTADYLLALTLGVRSAELTELHRNAGTLHLLAISGFHVAALASLAGLFFRRGRAKLLGVSAVVWGFVLLSGASPGGLRAAVALQIYLFSLQFGRTCRAFNSVSLAGVLLLLVNPWYFFDPGWRLSMLAALFLSAFAQTLKDSSPAALAASSPLVWLVTAAQTAFVFGAVPLAGLFINVLAVPLFAVIFPLILALSLPALAGVPCGAYAAGACEYILEAWDWAAGAAAGLIPWDISCSRQLFVLSSAVFCMAVLRASGFSKIKTTVGAFLLPFLLLLSA